MRHLNKALAAMAVAVFLPLTSCSSPMIQVEVRTTPTGAHIYVNGEPQGVTPRMVTFDFTESERNLLQLFVPGRPPVEQPYTERELPRSGPIMVNIAR